MKPTVLSFICILWGNECISVHIQNSEPTGDLRLGSKDSVIRRQVVGRLRLCLPSILGIFFQPNVVLDSWALMRISEEAVTQQMRFFMWIIPTKKKYFSNYSQGTGIFKQNAHITLWKSNRFNFQFFIQKKPLSFWQIPFSVFLSQICVAAGAESFDPNILHPKFSHS